MPAGMTYASLVTDLENYLQRDDALVVNQIPRFIFLSQIRIPREMKLLGFRQTVTGTFDGTAITSGLMQKPSDWRKTIGFYVGIGAANATHSPVFERTYEYIRQVYPLAQTGVVPSVPRFYGDANYDYWLVGPAPDTNYPFKIDYYATLTMLDQTTQTNWLTVNAPDLLLYACLMEAVPFVKVDERIPVWQGAYANAKAALQAQDLEGLYDNQQIAGNPSPVPAPPR